MIRSRCAALAVPLLLLGGLVGCDPAGGGSAGLPATDGKGPPPPLPPEKVGKDGRPKDSTASYDTAHGAKAP
jgi:hypothetical protein